MFILVLIRPKERKKKKFLLIIPISWSWLKFNAHIMCVVKILSKCNEFIYANIVVIRSIEI